MGKAKEMSCWMTERESIRVKREQGLPKPWSKDRIFRTTRFTNVRREDDKVTKWIAKNWRDSYWDSENLVPALVLARMINRPESLEAIGYPTTWTRGFETRIFAVSRERQSGGVPFWGNAYMITTCGVKMSKEQYVLDVANTVREGVLRICEVDNAWPQTCDDMHQWLMKRKGLGSFLAAQVVADLKNTPGSMLEGATDWFTWCASGPGSRKGLNYYLDMPPESPWNEKHFRHAIADAWLEVSPLLAPDLQDLHMQDFQNCFCEFSKYMRIKNGGRAKNGFSG